jgi:hypothetical protein
MTDEKLDFAQTSIQISPPNQDSVIYPWGVWGGGGKILEGGPNLGGPLDSVYF